MPSAQDHIATLQRALLTWISAQLLLPLPSPYLIQMLHPWLTFTSPLVAYHPAGDISTLADASVVTELIEKVDAALAKAPK